MFNLKKKGVSPAADSPTATLLRLHSNHLPNSRKGSNKDTEKKKGRCFFLIALCVLGELLLLQGMKIFRV